MLSQLAKTLDAMASNNIEEDGGIFNPEAAPIIQPSPLALVEIGVSFPPKAPQTEAIVQIQHKPIKPKP